MDWEKLKIALQSMPETGSSGFEGLAARLLELILKEKFILARSGDQPSGDAHNLNRSVCLQAKRYGGTALNAKNIEGDFDANLRALPETDVYVLAVTRNTAQIDDTLNEMRDKSGVDIIVFDFEDADSELSALCVEYWDQLQSFDCISRLNTEIKAWITTVRQSDQLKSRITKITSNLHYCTQTFTTTQKSAAKLLERRFEQADGQSLLVSYQIELSKSVPRTDYQIKVLNWWKGNAYKAMTIIGEEGMGKSWLAAQCATGVAALGDSLVLWLDSINWKCHFTLENILVEAISRLQIGDDKKVAHIVRKIRNQWSANILLVLDGVNERGALNAAQRILDDLISKEPGKCRILFTTRSLCNMSGYEPAVWAPSLELPVDRFNDEEFKSALSVITPKIELEEIPDNLASIARIPRYFQSCIKLRHRLESFSNISLSLVLWMDLLNKINGLEPQLKEKIGWANEQDAVEVLAKLATCLPVGNKQGVASDLLNRCFGGKYLEARHYLMELRIFMAAGTLEATLNPAHIILGKAFFLREVLRGLPESSISDMSDRLKRELEPLSGEDGAVESIFVALQLSALQDKHDSSSVTKQRAVLLHAWLFCHNSNASDERLKFWADNDLSAYAALTESFFENVYESSAQLFIVRPLAIIWKKDQKTAHELISILEKWLLLLWNNENAGQLQAVYNGHSLPVASNRQQVRLSAIALSIISLRPDNKLLKTLALCHASDSFSWETFKMPDGKDRQIPFKSIEKNIGLLMRWGYTEEVMPELERLARLHHDDKLLLKGLQWLAKILRTIEISPRLQLPPDTRQWVHHGRPAVDFIRKQKRIFAEKTQGKEFLNERNFSYLAVREDLPPLADEDIHKMIELVETMCSEAIKTNDAKQILEHDELKNWWPWYAKYRPMDISIRAGELYLFALKQNNPYSVLSFLRGIPAKFDGIAGDDWIKQVEIKYEDSPKSYREVDHSATMISEAILLSMTEEIIHDWIVKASSNGSLRTAMFFQPVSELLSLLMPLKTRLFASGKCQTLAEQAFGPAAGPPTEFQYWCYLMSQTAVPDYSIFEWAKRLLLPTRDNNDRNYSLVKLWLSSATPNSIEAVINDPNESFLLDLNALRAWAFDGDWPIDFKLICAPYEHLLRNLPIEFVGVILSRSGRQQDLMRWGDELFALAFKNVGNSPVKRQSKGITELMVGRNQKLNWVTFDYDYGRPRSGTSTVSSWGVDEASMEQMLLKGDEIEERYKQEFDKWRSEETSLENWKDADLHFFCAGFGLEAYRKLNPDQFAKHVHALFGLVKNDFASQFHIGGFLHAASTALLPDSPTEAWHYFEALNSGSLGIHVTNSINIPDFYTKLWNTTGCSLSEHKQLRLRLFGDCENEFEIMVLAIAALANNSTEELFEIVEQLLQNDRAKNRALAVSIMAWIGDDKSAQLLEKLQLDDCSDWVRSHSQWAMEVCLQEKSARSHYRKSLHNGNANLISAALQVLKPALTPVARWWHHQIKHEEEAGGLHLDSHSAAVVETFWRHWESIHSTSVTAVGKKLDEYCRGERLDALKTPRIAPWWNL